MAGIIKAGTMLNPNQGGVGQAYHFGDMENAYLERVRAEANAIIAKARQEAAALKVEAANQQAQAVEQGKKAAMQAAMQAAEQAIKTKIDQQLQSIIPAMEQAVNAILEARLAWQRHWEQQGLPLAIAIAERIIRRELSQRPEIQLDLIREALELAAGSPRLTLRLNPADHEALGERVTTLTQQLARVGETRVVADPSISLGGCRVESEYGAIDQQLEVQLARIAEELS